MEHILKLTLLELEMLFLESRLLARLRLHLVRLLGCLPWSLQNETLIDICDEIVVQMLIALNSHSLRNILALINYVAALHAFVVFHRFIQDLLYIHGAAHLLLLIDRVILSL